MIVAINVKPITIEISKCFEASLLPVAFSVLQASVHTLRPFSLQARSSWLLFVNGCIPSFSAENCLITLESESFIWWFTKQLILKLGPEEVPTLCINLFQGLSHWVLSNVRGLISGCREPSIPHCSDGWNVSTCFTTNFKANSWKLVEHSRSRSA